MTRRIADVLCVLVCLCNFADAAAPENPRYTAVMTNGSRIAGEEVTDWGTPEGTPRLANQPLLKTGNPVRWLLDNTLTVTRTPRAYVELSGGDRLPGVVVGAYLADEELPAVTIPDHLVVEPRAELRGTDNKVLQRIRVVGRMVRRVVWRSAGVGHYQPATVFCRDGRRLKFRRHRFLGDGVRVLTESGIQEFTFGEIAEFHAPQVDPWETYYAEVAALDPDLKDRLFRLETAAGLVVTGSARRFRVMPYGDASQPDTWHHLVHPAWSLDAFAIRHREIRLRTYFAPHEVPLSRMVPIYSENRSAIHAGWRWQANRNVHGRPLQNGPDGYGWGFGVHGLSELKFPLPAIARHFRVRAKLDRTAGGGGCVRAMVLAGSGSPAEEVHTENSRRQLYRSDMLIGSKTVLDTGNLPLRPAAAGEIAMLTLAVDPVYQGHPKDADPLDIRDTLNWLEPVVLLDRAALAAEVGRRTGLSIVAWNGWEINDADRVPFKLLSHWDSWPGQPENFRFFVEPSKPPFVLSRSITVTPKNHWLIVSASRPVGPADSADTPGSIIEVRLDGQPAGRYVVAGRPRGSDETLPLAVSLHSQVGRSVRLEIVQQPGDVGSGNLAIDWRAIAFAERLPMLREVFEDRAEVELLQDKPEKIATAEFSDEPSYSGDGCLRITPGGRVKINLADGPAQIRGGPKWGQYRYLRFALRKRGGGQVCLELGHDGEQDRPLRYFAGRGNSPCEPAKRVWTWSTHADLPDAWIVVTCDLHSDFNWLHADLTSISLRCAGGSDVLFDHIYLARTTDDLELVPAPRIATPDEAARKARAKMVRASLDKAFPATVLLGIDGRIYSGAIVSEDGYVLTCGHAVIGPKREVAVVLADGRQVKGQTLGVDRQSDAAMIKITAEGKYPFVKIAKPVADLRKELLLAVAHQATFEAGDRPLAHLTWLQDEVDGLLWTNFSQPIVGAGGPLLIATNGAPGEGQLVGIHSRYHWGAFLYTPAAKYQENWQRLQQGEVWGTWAPGAGPLLGIHSAEDESVYRISQLVPEGPAEKAQLQVGDVVKSIDGRPVPNPAGLSAVLGDRDPGQEVTLTIQRNDQTLEKKLILGARR